MVECTYTAEKRACLRLVGKINRFAASALGQSLKGVCDTLRLARRDDDFGSQGRRSFSNGEANS